MAAITAAASTPISRARIKCLRVLRDYSSGRDQIQFPYELPRDLESHGPLLAAEFDRLITHINRVIVMEDAVSWYSVLDTFLSCLTLYIADLPEFIRGPDGKPRPHTNPPVVTAPLAISVPTQLLLSSSSDSNDDPQPPRSSSSLHTSSPSSLEPDHRVEKGFAGLADDSAPPAGTSFTALYSDKEKSYRPVVARWFERPTSTRRLALALENLDDWLINQSETVWEPRYGLQLRRLSESAYLFVSTTGAARHRRFPWFNGDMRTEMRRSESVLSCK
ncbi:hypothetical protein HDU93_003267 [Gonapodya sp. JEL0774]|nr:hypothetical protein HDU93_003267 [Gonapodya sp. JEL0774]